MATLGEMQSLIADIDKPFETLRDHYINGVPPGISTGWRGFDDYFLFTPEGQLNVVTGAPSAGKSEWVNSLSINMMISHGWRTLVYSPETHPLEFHLRILCEKLTGKHFSGEYSGHQKMTMEELTMCQAVLKENFVAINAETGISTVDAILKAILFESRAKRINMAVIDPWNKLEVFRPKGISSTEYIGQSLTKIQIFARKYGISFWVVAHPAKPMKKKDGTYPEFTLYDVADSAHFYNMIDNGFIFTRDRQAKRSGNGIVKCSVEKIKNRLYGKEGDHYFEFDRRCAKFHDALPPQEEPEEVSKDSWHD